MSNLISACKLTGHRKSQLAIEFAHRSKQKSPDTWILWLYVSDNARFEQSVRGILDQLKVRGRNDPEVNVFQLLYAWLCDVRHGPWLVILDNADDARALLDNYSAHEQADQSAAGVHRPKIRLACIPRCDHGRVVVTSRNKEVARELVYDDQIIAIEPMKMKQALSLLTKKLGRWYAEHDAVQLAQELDFMPLALTQAAAYIRQSDGRCSIRQYLGKLVQCDESETSVLDIDEGDLRRDRESTNSIMLTWQISFDRIREMHSSAADLLSLMSFFDRQAISEALLHKRESMEVLSEVNNEATTLLAAHPGDGKEDRENLTSIEASTSMMSNLDFAPDDEADKFEKDLAVLRNYCLVAIATDTTIFKMHRLVQLATKRWLKANAQLERWASQFIINLDQAFPIGNRGDREICSPLYPHVIAAFHTQAGCRNTALRRASLLSRSGHYALETGSYTDAERMHCQALEARRTMLGERHADTLESMLNLAKVYMYNQQGHLDLAEELQLKVLASRREVLGEEHPDTLTCTSFLGETYIRQGRYDIAESLELEVMRMKKLVLGENHRATLLSMNNLAGTYSHLGRWEEAEKLHMEVIEKDKEVLEEDDPDAFTGMSGLARTWMRQGRFEEAETLQLAVLQKRREVLGDSHPDTLRSMSRLAWICLKQGRWHDVEKLQTQVIEKSRRVLGAGHPETLTNMATLAYMLRALGRRRSALDLMNAVVGDLPDGVGDCHYRRTREDWEREDSLLPGTGPGPSASDRPAAGIERFIRTLRNGFARRFH